jgi:hypothetical protein
MVYEREASAYLTSARRVVLIVSRYFTNLLMGRVVYPYSCVAKICTNSNSKSVPSVEMEVNLLPNKRLLRDDGCRGEGEAMHGEQMWKRRHMESRTSKPC